MGVAPQTHCHFLRWQKKIAMREWGRLWLQEAHDSPADRHEEQHAAQPCNSAQLPMQLSFATLHGCPCRHCLAIHRGHCPLTCTLPTCSRTKPGKCSGACSISLLLCMPQAAVAAARASRASAAAATAAASIAAGSAAAGTTAAAAAAASAGMLPPVGMQPTCTSHVLKLQ